MTMSSESQIQSLTERNVVVCDAEVEAAEPEPRGAAAQQAIGVPAPECAGEVAVFPGTIEMVVGIVAAGVVADPLVVGVDVWSIRVAFLIDEFGMLGRGARCAVHRRGTVGGDVAAAYAVRGRV